MVSKECWIKILGNWLINNDEIDYATYNVVLENELSFDPENEDILQKTVEYFFAGKTKQSTSIAYKVYKKYIEGVDNAQSYLANMIKKIQRKITCDVYCFDGIKADSLGIFIDNYCRDITSYNAAKECRFERFIDYIQKEIDKSLERKSSYILRFPSFISIIQRVTEEISDHKYIININETRAKKRKEAENLLNGSRVREVEQLKIVSDNPGFIVKELVNELLYKDFRNVYVDNANTTIVSNMEYTAYSNYEDVKLSFESNPGPKMVFDKTVEKPIPSSIVDNSPIYIHGCYVFLTGDDADSDKQITWGY